MGVGIGIISMYGLLRLLNHEAGSIKLCTAIYFVIRMFSGIVFGSMIYETNILTVVITVCFLTLLAYWYFTLLERTAGIIRWVILVVGALLLFI